MDANEDNKSLVEKAVDVVKEFAATVSAAAHKVPKSKRASPDDEIIMMPSAPTGFMDDVVAQPLVLVRKRKKPRKARAKAARKTGKKSTKSASSPTRRKSAAAKKRSSKKAKTKKSKTKKSKR